MHIPQVVLPVIGVYATVIMVTKKRWARPRTIALCAINVFTFVLASTVLSDIIPWNAVLALLFISSTAALSSVFFDTYVHPVNQRQRDESF
jgi:hypothetical protein